MGKQGNALNIFLRHSRDPTELSLRLKSECKIREGYIIAGTKHGVTQ